MADYLVDDGYAILWRNLRLGAFELDVVARKDDLVAIVEVRTRGEGSFEKPLESISKAKRRVLLRAADRLFRTRLAKDLSVRRLRIDVAAVSYDDRDQPRVEHVRGAITQS